MNEAGADFAGWVTLREIDAAQALPKGSAFRAFKRLLPELSEGPDFIVAGPPPYAALRAALAAAGRIYRGSVHPVLLSPAAAARLRVACGGGRG
ncbi:MAG: hypothetical protein ISP90_13765 [Nevskia sp.]|nr:hypothetical protein [Nevskia sp.]